MSGGLFQRQAQRAVPACGYCGRTLSTGFYYVCHTCGATYCYAHSPKKCEHRKVRLPPVNIATSKA